jgi:hypothetical protein
MNWLYFFAATLINRNEVDIPQGEVSQNNIANALSLVFGIAGGIALLVVTLGGLKYVLSQGNPQETAKAKNTILAALVGLVVCLLAFSIVRFVLREV